MRREFGELLASELGSRRRLPEATQQPEQYALGVEPPVPLQATAHVQRSGAYSYTRRRQPIIHHSYH
jgi:hypothetical protein